MSVSQFTFARCIPLNWTYQQSNITKTKLDRKSGLQRGLRERRLLESIPFDKPAKKPLIKRSLSRSPH